MQQSAQGVQPLAGKHTQGPVWDLRGTSAEFLISAVYCFLAIQQRRGAGTGKIVLDMDIDADEFFAALTSMAVRGTLLTRWGVVPVAADCDHRVVILTVTPDSSPA